MDEKKSFAPVVLKCRSCGSPLAYDIYHQNYGCSFCGAQSKVEEVIGERRGWVREQSVKNEAAALHSKKEFYSCSGCGAKVMVPGGEILGKCEFCGGKVVPREFTQNDTLPDAIIPFRLTRDEAMNRLEEWCKHNKNRPAAETILQHKKKLMGCYLPYQLVKGPLNSFVQRGGCMQVYDVRTHLNEIAVNTSSNLRNDLLDAVEPFDWQESMPFEFGILGDEKIKLQDVGPAELGRRIDSEVENDFLNVLEKIFDARDLRIKFDQHDLLVMSVALPMYIARTSGLTMAINGQTGRVAVTKEKVKSSWLKLLIEPTLITLAIFLVGIFCNVMWGGGFKEGFWLSALIAGVAALPTFIAFTQNRGPVEEDPILRTKPVKASREMGAIKFTETDEDKPIPTPIFFERLKSGVQAVHVKFYTAGRIIQWIAWALLFNFLPVIFALIINGFEFKELDWTGGAVWWTLFIPFTFIFYIAKIRNGVYDYPELYYYNEDGSMGKKVPSTEFSNRIIQSTWELFKELMHEGIFIGMFIFILICLIICSAIISGLA